MPQRISIDTSDFLHAVWQRKPLLIRQAVPGFRSPLGADELAGLAMEPDIESRIVGCRQGQWELRHGPFSDADFQRDDAWTLLVQSVDRYVPAVTQLRSLVDFIPNWRFDDIMISYANDGGSVGPHFDRYDVFLLQGEGKRRWQLGDWCDSNTPQLSHEGLNLLRSFTAREEYLLEPGDVLYVPPGLAHWGVAVGECMTYSLGFRAPTMGDLLARLTDGVLDTLKSELLLEDQDSLSITDRPGELTEAHRVNARDAILRAIEALDDGRWLGELLSEGGIDADEAPSVVLPGEVMLAWPSQTVWIDRGHSIELFLAGASVMLDTACLPLIMRLCAGEPTVFPDPEPQHEPLFEFLIGLNGLVNADL